MIVSCALALILPFIGNVNKNFNDAWQKACRDGADAKVIFKIVDDDGVPVEGARYCIPLWYRSEKQSKLFKGVTDKSGVVVVEGKCTEDIPSWYVEKDGYYMASGCVKFAVYDEKRLKDGKWLPYGEEKVVVLKRIKNPIPMYAGLTFSDFSFPLLDEYVGYDIKMRDWVSPYGKGEESDFLIKLTWNGETNIRDMACKVYLKTAKEGDGICVLNKDTESVLASPHRVPDDLEYFHDLSFDVTYGIVHKKQKRGMPSNKMLIIRSRTSNYSKIYRLDIGPNMPRSANKDKGKAPFVMNVETYFNPTPNDTNLEFDGKKNLLKDRWGGFSAPTLSR